MTSVGVIDTAGALVQLRASLEAAGRTVALVPTMGALHEGHLSLMREARRRADHVFASIFVNPRQFGPGEDLARYPRDLPGDLAKCASAGVEWVFAPSEAEMYPPGWCGKSRPAAVALPLEGERRPGHFQGVVHAVERLFELFRPHVALFGEKDWQQLQVIRAMVRDLWLRVEIVGCPIVREPDGLAMSSRNAYLTPEERPRALALKRALERVQELARGGERRTAELREAGCAVMRAHGVEPDYVAVAHPETLATPRELGPGTWRVLVAGRLGQTRLIDNDALFVAA